MAAEITKRRSPEELELENKLARLAALESELAARELDLATLRASLNSFEKTYLAIVGKRYAELDEVRAKIAEAEARLKPHSKEAKEKAAEARRCAQESASAAAQVDAVPQTSFQPSETLKALYRQAAKALHPDLAGCDEDRARRHSFMARVNAAYEAGDEAAIRAILREWDSAPESVHGVGVGPDLIRTIRKIARVEDRLRAIHDEITALRASNIAKMKKRAEEAAARGSDLLAETAAQIAGEITAAHARLAQLERGGKP